MIKIFKEINQKRYDTLAGTLSFFFILNCIPIAYLTLFFYDKIATNLNIELEFLNKIKEILSFDISIGVSIFFIIATIYSSSQLFTQVKKTGEIIYNVKKPKSSIKVKLLSLLGTLLFSIIIIIGLLILGFANHLIKNFPPIIIQIITIMIISIIYYFLVVLIDKLASPRTDIKEKVTKGAIITMLYTIIASALFYIYITLFSSYNFLYGYLTTLLIFLLWVYLLMKGIIIGIVVNHMK